MTPFDELSRPGRSQRMRHLARVALDAFGIGAARVTLARDAGNTSYRVYASAAPDHGSENDLFEPGQFLLRIHWPGYRTPGAIALEMEWLRALRIHGNLPVPTPVRTPAGDVPIQVSFPGIPKPRYCSLLRWVKGRRIGARAGAKHFAAQGRLMAGMHNVSQQWQSSQEATPRRYDWHGLFKGIPALCLPVDDVWSLLPVYYLRPFSEVALRVHRAMDGLGMGRKAFGMIHADLGVDANLLFWRGHPRAIDFDESGLGYWVYDLAVALEHCREQEGFSRNRDELLDAYLQVRTLPAEQLRYLELFMAALDVHIGVWANAAARLRPRRTDLRTRAARCLRLAEAYLEREST